MIKLLKIELKKSLPNKMFWASLSIYLFALIGAILLINSRVQDVNQVMEEASNLSILPNDILSFPNVYHNFSFIARFLKVFMGIIIIVLITNEYTYKTLRQNFIDGLSRGELVLSKFCVAISLAIFASLVLLVLSLLFGAIYTKNFYLWKLTDQLVYIPKYFLMLLAFMSFASFIAFILKKTGISLIAMLFYIYIFEPILASKYSDSFGHYLPVNQINTLIPIPAQDFLNFISSNEKLIQSETSNIIFVVSYSSIFFFASYFYLKRKDL